MQPIYTEKRLCCGCRACEQMCPTNAISMVPDEQGFLYPSVDVGQCVECGQCIRICAFPNPVKHREPESVYAARLKDEAARMLSQSGGVFTALAEGMLHGDDGVVYGVALDGTLRAVHMRAQSIEDITPMKTSKYVQSDTNNVYTQVQDDLQSGKRVLFSGTPCQVDGLNSFLRAKRVDTQTLLTMDIVCHGVPSPMVFRDYIALLEKRHRAQITGFVFRNKKYGWHGKTETYSLSGNPNKTYSGNVFVRLFMLHHINRPCCFACPYADTSRVSDITAGDFWGIENAMPDFWNETGVSLLIVNTEKGNRSLDSVHGLDLRLSRMEDAAKEQPNLSRPTVEPSDRGTFWRTYAQGGAKRALRRYGGYTWLNTLKKRIRKYL